MNHVTKTYNVNWPINSGCISEIVNRARKIYADNNGLVIKIRNTGKHESLFSYGRHCLKLMLLEFYKGSVAEIKVEGEQDKKVLELIADQIGNIFSVESEYISPIKLPERDYLSLAHDDLFD